MEAITVLFLVTFCIISVIKGIHTKVPRPWLRHQKPIPFHFGTPKPELPSKKKDVPLQETRPYVLPRLPPKGPAPTSMGLRRLETVNWLTMDDNYIPEHLIRKSFLATRHPQVVQCLAGSREACHEVLALVVDFLTARYPQHFTLSHTSSGPVIHNHLTNESFQIGDDCKNPLEIASQLAMEDFNVLIKDSETGDHHLMASVTLFPAGWKLKERIGFSMAKLHAPVPEWKKNLSGSVGRYFGHLNPRNSMERYNLFIQASSDLFMDAPEIAHPSTTPECLYVRRERQTFRRLPKSQAVLFTVRTFMKPLVDLDENEAVALRQQVGGWEGLSRRYKGSEAWGNAFAEWERRVVERKRGSGGVEAVGEEK